jgi:hypothetical protein
MRYYNANFIAAGRYWRAFEPIPDDIQLPAPENTPACRQSESQPRQNMPVIGRVSPEARVAVALEELVPAPRALPRTTQRQRTPAAARRLGFCDKSRRKSLITTVYAVPQLPTAAR